MAQMKVVSEKYDVMDKMYEFKTQLTCYDVRSGCYKVPEGEKTIGNDILPRIKFKVSYNQCMNLQLELIGIGIDDCPIDVLILQVFQDKSSPDGERPSIGSDSNGTKISGVKVSNDQDRSLTCSGHFSGHFSGHTLTDDSAHWTGINVSNQRSSTKILKSVTIMSPDQVKVTCRYTFKVPTIFIFKFIFVSSAIFVSKCRKFSNHDYSQLFIHDKSMVSSFASMSIVSSPLSIVSSPCIKDTYQEEDNYADIEFIVERRSIKAHRVVLSSKSSVFRTLFWSKSHLMTPGGNNSKSGSNSSSSAPSGGGQLNACAMVRIEVPDISYRTFYLFIKSLYSGHLETETLKESLELLRLSHKYNIIDLKRAAIELIEELESESDAGLNDFGNGSH